LKEIIDGGVGGEKHLFKKENLYDRMKNDINNDV
jgi:hypothetical protein